MPLRVCRQFRIRTAAIVAVVYTLCVVAPSLALAFSDSPTAHCLTEDLVGTTPHHHDAGHQHGTAAGHHRHAESGAAGHRADHDQKNQPRTCCNLFSLVAIPSAATIVLITVRVARPDFLALEDALRGQAPDRINRPPIA